MRINLTHLQSVSDTDPCKRSKLSLIFTFNSVFLMMPITRSYATPGWLCSAFNKAALSVCEATTSCLSSWVQNKVKITKLIIYTEYVCENPEKQVTKSTTPLRRRERWVCVNFTCVKIGRMIAGQVNEVITELSPIVIAFSLGFLSLLNQEAPDFD